MNYEKCEHDNNTTLELYIIMYNVVFIIYQNYSKYVSGSYLVKFNTHHI